MHHFWQETILNGRRCWNFVDKPDQIEEADWEAFPEEMLTRCIRFTEGQDVLRWGYMDRGMFNIKEAYNIQIGNRVEEEETWKKIWTLNLWPKVGLFAWLVVRGHILTCENLQMHGVHGPSQCCLCSQVKETTSHVLDCFPYASAIWDKGAIGFRRSDR